MEIMNIMPEVNQRYPLSMAAMPLGMWEVTEENWGEFYVRIKLMELKCGGAFIKNSITNEDLPVTPAMAKEHIGMMIRSANEERNAWLLRIFGGTAAELEYAVEKFDPSVEFPRPEEDDDEL